MGGGLSPGGVTADVLLSHRMWCWDGGSAGGGRSTEVGAVICRNVGQGGGGLGGAPGMNMDALLNMFGGLGGMAPPSNPDGTWV